MLHWCGIGQRSTPLDFWKVFLLRAKGDVVGVSGLYRQPGMAGTVCWVGWFGIRPRFRRPGLGRNSVYALIEFDRSLDCKELWVYTGSSDHVAITFYQKLGFELLGTAVDWAPGQTMNDADAVLRRILSQTET
jgi:RimJ/RimL family protein N-acetyltransferase